MDGFIRQKILLRSSCPKGLHAKAARHCQRTIRDRGVMWKRERRSLWLAGGWGPCRGFVSQGQLYRDQRPLVAKTLDHTCKLSVTSSSGSSGAISATQNRPRAHSYSTNATSLTQPNAVQNTQNRTQLDIHTLSQLTCGACSGGAIQTLAACDVISMPQRFDQIKAGSRNLLD
jgi:hypothetical protein